MPKLLTFDEIVNAVKDDDAKSQVTAKLEQLKWPRMPINGRFCIATL
jgi:putative component of toxin-antitoxin plasmid stabilization module